MLQVLVQQGLCGEILFGTKQTVFPNILDVEKCVNCESQNNSEQLGINHEAL